MLQITDLTYRIAGRTLLDRASATVHAGHRVSLIGRNGTGKTTLFRLIQGELTTDGGSIYVPPGTRVGAVAQEAPSSSATLLETVLAADVERAHLLSEAETATDPERIAEVYVRLADIQAHSAPARAAQILAGLGFDHEAQQRPCSDFSGGWRMRVALAGVLFSQPELLLLDEPTNHLDLEATLWLEEYLRSYPHTILLISHDRELLNKVPTTTLHLDQGKLVAYTGGFDQFERTRRMRLEHLSAQAVKQEAQRKHMQAFVDRFRSKASKARQAQSRIKALEKLGPPISIIEEHTVSFNFPQPDELAPPLIVLDHASVGYDGKPVLRNLNLRIDPDDRIALLGANGNGKSTLVKLLAGRLNPMDGEIRRSAKVRVGYFAQHQAEELDLSRTALAEAQARMPKATIEQVRNHLGRFGFSQDRAATRIGQMSGGEKARLLLALTARETPNILLMDEPTNHLDIDSRNALVEALNAFEGAVILISHDPHLIELTVDRLLLVGEGTCSPFDGDLDDYKRLLLERARGSRTASRDDGKVRKDQRRASAEIRATLAPLRRKVADGEKLVEKLTAQAKTLDAKLADPALYSGPADAIKKLQLELGEVRKKLATAEEAWLEALAAFETAQSEAAE